MLITFRTLSALSSLGAGLGSSLRIVQAHHAHGTGLVA